MAAPDSGSDDTESPGSSGDGTRGWFEGLDPDDLASLVDRISDGQAPEPSDWPTRAVESGFADTDAEYYDRLHEATRSATEQAVQELDRADDRQLIHAVRAMDDARRTSNELAERISEWAGSLLGISETGLDCVRTVADIDADGPLETRLVSLAARASDLATEADELEAFVQRYAPTVAPNLSALAGPVLAARLIALAGGLKPLARMPSGTVQVLGAESALFAHLRGEAPSPKHGVIYMHEYVRNTRPEDRGSAARAVAGKLTIAARVDHYSGERRPGLDSELDERIETIRARAEDGNE